jgi:hypothetical protein
MVDVYKTDSSTNIVPEQIEELPTQNRDFQQLAFIAPGVQRERGGFRFITGAPVVGSGGNASQTTIMVDGVDFTDQALGLSRARFSQDAIREFRVINNRFDTEIGNSQGGALSIITKSGTNQLRGSVFGFYRADSLREEGELETGTEDFTRYQLGATLGGPITRDRAHYFASVEYIDEDDIALFRPLGAFAGLAEDYEHPFDQLLGLFSLNHQPSQDVSLEGKLVYEQYREDNFRVGGVCGLDCGMELNRDNWNLTGGGTWMIGDTRLNELRVQVGHKEFDEPNNSDARTEYFTFGTTLQAGANIVGDQSMEGDYVEVRDTMHWFLGAEGNHDLKVGAGAMWIDEAWDYPLFPQGLLWWASDAGVFAFRYDYGDGPGDVSVDTTLYNVFIQDDWRVTPNLSVSLGLRYDYDSDGNNPDFTHPVVPEDRSVDDDNLQPRVGLSWDVSGDGSSVLRGGAGIFTGRYLLVPSLIEKHQNGITGRRLLTRLSVPDFGLIIDPNDPENTGLLLPPNSTLLAPSLEAPESWQASLGFAQRLGDTGLYLDLEGVYVEGDNEIVVRDTNFGGNDNPIRPNPSWTQINMYTNEGRSEYTALIASLNGTLQGGHLITASVTYGDKKNIADDFSPALVNYPSDPADIEGEWGRSRADEEWRVVLSGVFRLPAGFTVAPVYQYGSGQPWNRRLGYDFNGDGRLSDRAEGVPRNSEDGPDFKQLNLRITKAFDIGVDAELELIVEAFNLFDTVNYDPSSVDSAEYLAGPTLADPEAQYIPNPNFGEYAATLDPREIQVGLRYRF